MPPYRPPSEANSILIRAVRNCPWNKCAFCAMYKGKPFSIRKVEEVKRDIETAKKIFIGSKTLFIGDSDPLIMRTEQLAEIVKHAYRVFPNLVRVTSYARAKTVIRTKSKEDMRTLREAGLTRIHMGLETGDPWLLEFVKKGATPEEIVEAGRMVLDAGMELTEYVIIGLGGEWWSEQHALGTAEVLNKINPTFIRLRTLVLFPQAPLYELAQRGEFKPISPLNALREIRLLLEKLNVNSWFLSDHVSNYLPVNGKLPDDKKDLLEFLDYHIELIEKNPDMTYKVLTPEHIRSRL